MQSLKRWLHWSLKWQYSGLCLLVLLTLVLHLSTIMKPAEPVFDGQHYVNDARSIISGEDTQRAEHPPLARLIIQAGIRLFGDNPFGWRFFPVLFGMACVLLFYFICRTLSMSNEATLLATFLFSLENMIFLQASVAMLDVYTLTFMLAAFFLYLRGSYVMSGISAGLGTLAKLTGALALPVIFLHWLLGRRSRVKHFAALLFLAPISFFLFLPGFDLLTTGRLLDPVDHIRTMLSLSGSLTFASVTHVAASRPWEWLLLPQVMFYWYDPQYIGAISFNVWALIMPAVGYMLFRAIRRDAASLFGLSWFVGTYLLWIPLSILTDRVSYVYYFYPTVGAICIGIGLGLSRLLEVWRSRRRGKLAWAARLSVWGYLASHVAVFVILSPVFARWVSVIPIPE